MIRQLKSANLLASCATCALFAQAPAAFSQEVTDLDAVSLLGAFTAQPLSNTAASTEVVDEQELEDAPASLANRLAREPGVSFSQSGPLGTVSSVSIRGLPSYYVGVQIDGIDVTDPGAPQTRFDFGGMTTIGLGRVEILKGSQSALHGSEAIGGVIDIQSARPTELGFSGSVTGELGSYDTYRSGVLLGYKDERGEVALNISHLSSEGFSARSGNVENDGVEQVLGTLTLRYALSDTFTMGGAVLWRDLDYDFDNTDTDPTGTGEVKQRGVRIFGELVTGRVTHLLSYSHYDSDTGIVTGTYSSDFNGKRDKLSYLASAALGGAAGATVNFGLDYMEETYESAAITASVETKTAFAEILVSPGDVDLALALRYDDHSQFGGQFSGRLGAVWHVGTNTDLRAVLSTGYRAPSLNELYGPFGSNPALQPEESRSAELGIEHRFAGQGKIGATLFYTEVDNLIEYVWPTGYIQVPGTAVSKGAEISGEYALNEQVTVYGAYTYTDAKDGAGLRRVQVPRNVFVLGLDAELAPRLSGNFEVMHSADALPSAFAPAGNKVGSYTLLNAGLDYEISDNATAYLRVENLTDEDYETVGGYTQPGRSVFFGVRATF